MVALLMTAKAKVDAGDKVTGATISVCHSPVSRISVACFSAHLFLTCSENCSLLRPLCGFGAPICVMAS